MMKCKGIFSTEIGAGVQRDCREEGPTCRQVGGVLMADPRDGLLAPGFQGDGKSPGKFREKLRLFPARSVVWVRPANSNQKPMARQRQQSCHGLPLCETCHIHSLPGRGWISGFAAWNPVAKSVRLFRSAGNIGQGLQTDKSCGIPLGGVLMKRSFIMSNALRRPDTILKKSCRYHYRNPQKGNITIRREAYMRTRNHAITIRMEQKEYDALMGKVKESGQTQQSFIINSALGARISNKEELREVKKLSELCANNNRQLRGIGTNINQMAKIAHQTGTLPSITELKSITTEVKILRGKEDKNWQSIRQLISLQTPTGQCETVSNMS